VYLVFKENIQIATFPKRGNKNVDIKFSAHERFWNNLHQVAQDQKIGKPNNLIVLGAQNLCTELSQIDKRCIYVGFFSFCLIFLIGLFCFVFVCL
jgi:hypothetical protein